MLKKSNLATKEDAQAMSKEAKPAKMTSPKNNSPGKGAKDNNSWWADGVRFQCQGSGKCCVSHGEFGYVYLTLEDRRRMAKVLGMSTSAFTRVHCLMTDGVYHLKDDGGDCRFLKNKRCTVYEGRPVQCRTWPFWPEVMSAKAWAKEVQNFCPGVGKGRVVRATEIRSTLDEQIKWEDELRSGK